MKKLTTTQQMFLETSIKNSLLDIDKIQSYRILDQGTQKPYLILNVNHDEKTLEVSVPKEHAPLGQDELSPFLIKKMEQCNSELRIEYPDKILRLALRKGSIVRETLPVEKEEQLTTARWAVGKSTHLDPVEAAPLLKTIGVMTADGEIKSPLRKKFKQINHFLDLVLPLLRYPTKRPYSIVDCGCGKSYLGFALYWYVRQVVKQSAQFLGVDTSESVVQTAQDRAEAMNLSAMQFDVSAIIKAKVPDPVDLLVSLHACDTATDEAIALGVASRCRHIVVAPCCQHEIANQLKSVPFYPIQSHGIFTQRFGDLITDMVRTLFLEAHGYTVTVGEFIGSEETPKNLMIRAVRGNNKSEQRMKEYETFKQQYGIYPMLDILYREREAVGQAL